MTSQQDTELLEILRSEFYVNEHENCSKDCSKRFYADEAFSRAVAEIESLISEAVNKALINEWNLISETMHSAGIQAELFLGKTRTERIAELETPNQVEGEK